MTEEQRHVRCGNCGQTLPEGTGRCSRCGSQSKVYDERLTDSILLQSGTKFIHLDPAGSKRAQGTTREGVSGRTGRPVNVSFTQDFEHGLQQHRVLETQPSGAVEDVHLETVPPKRKLHSSWINEQISAVAAPRGYRIHRRFVEYDQRTGWFLVRLGKSPRVHRLKARIVKRAVSGSRAARRQIRDHLTRAVREEAASAI